MISMPIERYFELDITYKCSARCRHCIFASSPEKGGLMSAKDAKMYLSEIKKLGFNGRDVITTGGEALLYFDRVLDILKAARDLGMATVKSVQSNASWCNSDDQTRLRLTELRDNGLEGIYFSADAYHQEYVPIEKVRRGVRIADQVFGRDFVAVSMPRKELESGELPTVEGYFEDGSAGRIHLIARSTRTLAPRLPTIPIEEILEMNCRGGSCDIDPSSVWQINIDPYGLVSSWICSGILLGNAKKIPLSQIVSRPLTEQPQIVQDLVESGPRALLGLSEAHGYQPRSEYGSKCHFCWDVREAIYPHYPDLFAPAELYRD